MICHLLSPTECTSRSSLLFFDYSELTFSDFDVGFHKPVLPEFYAVSWFSQSDHTGSHFFFQNPKSHWSFESCLLAYCKKTQYCRKCLNIKSLFCVMGGISSEITLHLVVKVSRIPYFTEREITKVNLAVDGRKFVRIFFGNFWNK